MNWISVKDKLPIKCKELSNRVVMIDVEAGISPFFGWYDFSEKGGGFLSGNAGSSRRVVCSHYIQLPDHRSLYKVYQADKT